MESIGLPLIGLEKIGWKVTRKWDGMKFPHGIFLGVARNLSLGCISWIELEPLDIFILR